MVTTREATGNSATDFAAALNREVISSNMVKVEMANNIHFHMGILALNSFILQRRMSLGMYINEV